MARSPCRSSLVMTPVGAISPSSAGSAPGCPRTIPPHRSSVPQNCSSSCRSARRPTAASVKRWPMAWPTTGSRSDLEMTKRVPLRQPHAFSSPAQGRVAARFRSSPARIFPPMHAPRSHAGMAGVTTAPAWMMHAVPWHMPKKWARPSASPPSTGCREKAMAAPPAASCPHAGMPNCRGLKDSLGIAINSSPIASSGRQTCAPSPVRAVSFPCSPIRLSALRERLSSWRRMPIKTSGS